MIKKESVKFYSTGPQVLRRKMVFVSGPPKVLIHKMVFVSGPPKVPPILMNLPGLPTGPPNTKPTRFCVLYDSIADDTMASSADPSEDLIIIFLTTVPFF